MNDVLFVFALKKNLYLVFYIIDFQFRVAFEGKQCTIIDFNLASPRTLVRGMWDGGLYRLLANPLALVYVVEKQGEPSSFEEGDAEHAWWDSMEIGSKPIMESIIDSRIAIYVSVERYYDGVVGLF